MSLYLSLESFAKSLGPVEVVARDRYVLFRSSRIFVDLSVMTDALRVAVHLNRRADVPLFFKVVAERNRVTHVTKVQSERELGELKPYLREAYAASVSETLA